MAESVLVVDDDPDVARFVEVNLRSAGYDVTVASNGEEGLEKAVELRPDLVLLDVMMPKLDGFEVAQRLRRDPRTSSSSIIMLTAKALSSDKVLGLCAGATGDGNGQRDRRPRGVRRPCGRRRLRDDRRPRCGGDGGREAVRTLRRAGPCAVRP